LYLILITKVCIHPKNRKKNNHGVTRMTTFRKNSPFGGKLLFQIFRVIRSFDLARHAGGLAAHALSVPDFSEIGWISTLRHGVRFAELMNQLIDMRKKVSFTQAFHLRV